MLVRVNAATFAAESSQLGAAALKLQTATSTAAGQLASCSGMAGIDPMAEEFALGSKQEGGYDQSMQSVIDAGVTLSQAIAGFEGYLLGLASGYRAIELAGVQSGPNPYSSMTPTTVASSCQYVASSLGDEQRGTTQGEIMEWIENFLKDTAGIVIPTADTDKVRRAAGVWDSFSSELLAAKATVTSALPGTAAATFPQQGDVLAVQSRLAALIDDLADDAKALGDGCSSYASNVESIRSELMSMLGQLALEVAIDVGVGIALSFITFGAGAAAGLAKAATTVARWIPKIVSVLQRLRMLIMSAKRTMAVMRRAAIESIKSTVSGTIANAGASLAFGNFSWDGLGAAALSSSVSGAVAGPFSHIGSNVASRGTRITKRAGVDGLTGGVGGAAGDWVASQVTGQDFNLLMSALVGTVGGAAGGGAGAVKNPKVHVATGDVNTPNVNVSSGGGSKPGAGSQVGSTGGAGTNGSGTNGVPSGSTPTGGVAGGGASGGTGGGGVPSIDAPSVGGGASGGGASGGGGGAAGGGAGAPDGHVDVPGSLSPDGPVTDGPAVEGPTDGPSADGPSTDAPDSKPDTTEWTSESDGNGWTPESDRNGWTSESDRNGWTPETDRNGRTSQSDGRSDTSDVNDADGSSAKPDESVGDSAADPHADSHADPAVHPDDSSAPASDTFTADTPATDTPTTDTPATESGSEVPAGSRLKNDTGNADDPSTWPVLRDGSHLNDDGSLKPNVRYQSGEFEYIYTTDENGHISSFHTDELQMKTHEGRLRHDPNTLGKLEGDHAGHVVADLFGGSPKLDNLVSQLREVNLSQYRKLEIQWANALDPNQPGGPKTVSVDVQIRTDPATGRPTGFDVKYTIDGKLFKKSISNI